MQPSAEPTSPPPRVPRVVAIAASAGGVKALPLVLGALPADFPAVVLVVQHRSAHRPELLAEILERRCRLPVCQARDGEVVRGGVVYVCPPDRHVRMDSSGVLRVAAGPRVNYLPSSADPLFASVAECAGPRAVAVVLTGRGHDGAAGAAAIRQRGGLVLAQDPATCDSPSMPRAVIAGGGADFVLPPDTLGSALATLVMAPAISAALFGLPAVAV